MEHPIYFEPKNSTKLFGLQENFEFLSELYLKKKLPNVLMFTGHKGIGKSTLINKVSQTATCPFVLKSIIWVFLPCLNKLKLSVNFFPSRPP